MIARIHAQIVIDLDDQPLRDASDSRVKEAIEIATLKVLREAMPTATCNVTAAFFRERHLNEN